ncbi:MAG: DMT family transporter [Hyphomicrobium sp.]
MRRQRTLIGIGWMVLTGLLFVAVTGIVRHLGSNLPAVEAAFIRYAFGLVLVLPVLLRVGSRIPRGRAMTLCIARGVVHGGGVMLWFFAMARIPIAEVTAIGYTAPIFTTLGAAFFLGERLRARRVGAMIAGFIGVIVILRPGFQTMQLGSLAQLTAAPLFAVSFLLAKKLTETESPAMIVAMLSIFCTITLLPGALLQWRAPTGVELSWLFLTAVFATAGHYTLTRAFEAAPITVTQPVSFLQLVWAMLLGMLLFGERVDAWILLGGAIIVGAATYISHREAMAARRSLAKPTAD